MVVSFFWFVVVSLLFFLKAGRDDEIWNFNEWLGKLKESKRFKHIIVITGNHDVRQVKEDFFRGKVGPEALEGDLLKEKVHMSPLL